MKEDFLHYLWKHALFFQNLKTIDNEPVTVIHPGWFNVDAGPDFFNARIRIGNTEWAGNVEMHLRSSDWYLHGHDTDAAYESVILHVVMQHDQEVYRSQGLKIPVLVVQHGFDPELYQHYLRLLVNQNFISCENLLHTLEPVRLQNWLDRMLLSRFERKEQLLIAALKNTGGDLEELFYQKVAESFGMKVNAEAFALLSRRTPLKILGRHHASPEELEAILFGQAGFLNETCSEQYPVRLTAAYQFFRQRYSLEPMDNHIWKFLRMRPVNFPTIRISQLANLLSGSDRMMNRLLHTEDLGSIQHILDVDCSAYWQDHYMFGKLSTPKEKRLGKDAIISVIINAIIPFRFFNARRKGDEESAGSALRMLYEIGFEENGLTRYWRNLGVPDGSAWESQALIELKQSYCDQKRCLHCHIGQHLLVKPMASVPEV